MYLGNIEKKTKIKIYLVLILFIIGFGIVWEKIYDIQILQHGKFLNLSNRQYYRTLSPMPVRGTIYDRAGRELAVSVEADSVYANPLELDDPYKTANIISQTLKVDSSRLFREFNKEKGFIWIKRKVTPDEADAVESLNIKGIGFVQASHFLRNIGFTEYAILDKNVMLSLYQFGVIYSPKPPTTRRKYLEIEDRVKEIAEELGIEIDELDLLLWSERTGRIPR